MSTLRPLLSFDSVVETAGYSEATGLPRSEIMRACAPHSGQEGRGSTVHVEGVESPGLRANRVQGWRVSCGSR